MIIPMKKAHIVVLKEECELLLKQLQKSGELMIISNGDNVASQNDNLLNRTEKAIEIIGDYSKKKPLFGDYLTTTYEDIATEKDDEKIALLEQVEIANDSISKNLALVKQLEEQITLLKPWVEIPFPLAQTKLCKMVKVHIGTFPINNRDYTIEQLEELLMQYGCIYQIATPTSEYYPLFYIATVDEDEIINTEIKATGYNDYELPDLNVTVEQEIAKKEEEIAKCNEVIKTEQEKLRELSEKNQQLEILSDQLSSQKVLKEVNPQYTNATSYIEGWVRSDSTERLEQFINEAISIYDIKYSDPEEDEEVPTCYKNCKAVAQFEPITDMYAIPNRKERDPNFIMSIWYWILFGMMMADAGYGLLIIIGGLVFKKLLRPRGTTLKLVNVITYCGVTTIIWGIIFGSYFGFTIPGMWYWFNPMEDPMQMLIVSVAIGGLHIITGLIYKAYINFSDHNWQEALAKQISWILILIGIAVFVIGILNTVAIVMIITGVALIIIFNGAGKKNPIKRLGFGLIGLYDVTSYLGDLLSYSRVMALAMSSASIAMVMNELANMVKGFGFIGIFFAIIIYIVGHLFNLVLGLLSAYVHDSRLQYIEFYGKFYEGGGIEFEPLTLQTKYVKEIKY